MLLVKSTAISALLVTLGALSSSTYAQMSVPVVQTTGNFVLPVTAAEAAHQLVVRRSRLEAGISLRAAHYPKDSMLTVVSASAAQWLAELQSRPLKGIQLDPAGHVSVGARNEATAKAQIAERGL